MDTTSEFFARTIVFVFKIPLKFIALIAALALFAVACGGGDSESSETNTAPGVSSNDTDGTTPPSDDAAETNEPAEVELPRQFFATSTADGGQIDLGDLDGQDIVLWFWAPW